LRKNHITYFIVKRQWSSFFDNATLFPAIPFLTINIGLGCPYRQGGKHDTHRYYC